MVIGTAIITWWYISDKRKNINQQKKGDWKKQLKLLLIIAVLGTIVGIISLHYSKRNRTELLAHKGITIGKIESYVKVGSTTSDEFKYTYWVYNEMLKGEHIGTWPNGGADNFIDKKFTVIFDSLDPRNERMLISPDDFKYYNMPFPDSLNWVLPYYSK